jgi:hypothetical protein
VDTTENGPDESRPTKGSTTAESTSETPVLGLLANMTAGSAAASSLDPETFMLVRIAALVAVDAPSFSYLMNLGMASDLDIDPERVRGVLAAVAPLSARRASHPLQARSSRRSTPRSRSLSSRSKAKTWILTDHLRSGRAIGLLSGDVGSGAPDADGVVRLCRSLVMQCN